MVRMIRALLLIAGVISMPAQSATSGAIYGTTGGSNCSAGVTFASGEPVPVSRFEEATRRQVEQLSLYNSIKSLSCPFSGTPVFCTGQVNIIQTNGLPAVWNFSCQWERKSPLECSAGMHISVWDGKCIPDCSEGEEEDANGQCKPKDEGDCDVGYERGEGGQCQPMEPKTPGELIPTNLNNGEPGDYGWEDSSISGPDTVRGPGGTACYGGHEYVYYSTVCTAHQTAGVYNCIAVDGRYTGNFCGGTTTPDYQAPGGGGNTPDPDPGNPDPGGNPGGNPDPGGNPGNGGTGGTGGTGGDGSGTGGNGGSGSGGAGDDGDDDMADIPPDDEFNSGDYDVLKPDEGTVRGWMQSAVNSLGLGPGGQCGNAQLESSIFGYPVSLNFVSFCTAIAPIINWFFWILVAYSVINTAMHLSGARTFSDSDRKAA